MVDLLAWRAQCLNGVDQTGVSSPLHQTFRLADLFHEGRAFKRVANSARCGQVVSGLGMLRDQRISTSAYKSTRLKCSPSRMRAVCREVRINMLPAFSMPMRALSLMAGAASSR